MVAYRRKIRVFTLENIPLYTLQNISEDEKSRKELIIWQIG